MISTMTTAPSDPDYINTYALERFMRSFDYAMRGKLHLDAEPNNSDAKVTPELMPPPRARAENLGQPEPAHQLRFWLSLRPLNTIRRFRDNIRLHKYNRYLLKKYHA